MTVSPPRADTLGNPKTEPLEIERKYLLRRAPDLPVEAVAYHIEQGYLPGGADEDSTGTGGIAEGRVRRRVGPDGATKHWHTIKRGAGEQRSEVERTITAEEFAVAWPATEGRRIVKTRSVVPARMGETEVVWEIDVFEGIDLVLAEVELPEAGRSVVFPDWLVEHVERDVTDEAGYTNYALATRGLPE